MREKFIIFKLIKFIFTKNKIDKIDCPQIKQLNLIHIKNKLIIDFI